MVSVNRVESNSIFRGMCSVDRLHAVCYCSKYFSRVVNRATTPFNTQAIGSVLRLEHRTVATCTERKMSTTAAIQTAFPRHWSQQLTDFAGQ